MDIDHIFIFSNSKGKEGDQLVDFGIEEGSNRHHPGQGTTNRKFYFDNFFLEILWVTNENEIQSPTTSITKLWERSRFFENACSRFGLCLENSMTTDAIFQQSKIYKPDYFPQGMSIEVITNENYPGLPWTFRLPYRDLKKANDEPKHHKNGIERLTKAVFEVDETSIKSQFVNHFHPVRTIDFVASHRSYLTLEFDHHMQEKSQEFPDLQLKILY